MAHDWIDLQARAAREFGRRLAAVTDWDAPTPDTEWTTRDLVAHVVDEQRWIPLLLSGCTYTEAKADLAPIGDDLVAAWDRFSAAASDAWATADPDAIVHLRTDSVRAAEYLSEQTSDITIHAWDLARATGADEHLDEHLVAAVWSVFEPQIDSLAASGLYDAPIQVDEDGPLQTRLLAVTGRDERITA